MSDDKIASLIIKKVQEVMKLNEQINEINKKLKPLREDKTLLMDELTNIFVDNHLETYEDETNNYVLKLVYKEKKNPINEELIKNSLNEEMIEKDFETFKKELLNSINDNRNTDEEIPSIRITKRKVKVKTKKNKKENKKEKTKKNEK